jgi:hypothetical protein
MGKIYRPVALSKGLLFCRVVVGGLSGNGLLQALLGLALTALAFLLAYFMQLRLYGEESRRPEAQRVV